MRAKLLQVAMLWALIVVNRSRSPTTNAHLHRLSHPYRRGTLASARRSATLVVSGPWTLAWKLPWVKLSSTAVPVSPCPAGGEHEYEEGPDMGTRHLPDILPGHSAGQCRRCGALRLQPAEIRRQLTVHLRQLALA